MCLIYTTGLEWTCSEPVSLVEGVPVDSAGGGLGGRIDSVIGDGKINANQNTSKKIVHIQKR